MIHSKKFFALLCVALHVLCTINAQTFQLSKFDYKSAAVLPTITKRNEKWAVLAREGYGITKKHTYDAFSGGREEEEMNATLSAAREFHEEAILEHVLKWGLKETEKFINPDKTENTWLVIAYEKDKDINDPKSRIIRNVTFITNFNKYKTKFFNNFYDARKKEMLRYEAEGIPGKYRTTTEKDKIARVRWTDLKRAIINQKNPDDPVYVCADVMDPITQKFNKELITLRPILVITLRPFFLNKDYEKGENEKIRYYDE